MMDINSAIRHTIFPCDLFTDPPLKGTQIEWSRHAPDEYGLTIPFDGTPFHGLRSSGQSAPSREGQE